MIYDIYLVLGFSLMFVLLRPVPARSSSTDFMKTVLADGFEIFWRPAVLALVCWAVFELPLSIGNERIVKFVLCFAAGYLLHLLRKREFEFFFCSLAFAVSAVIERPAAPAGQILLLLLYALHWMVFYVLLEGLRLRLLSAAPPRSWKGLPVFLMSAAFLVSILAAVQILSDLPR